MNQTIKEIQLHPVEMTKEVMQRLEDKGLIYRLYPGHHDLDVPEGETRVRSLYECQDKFGPHKLIVVTVNRPGLPGFGSHPDVEDFILMGDPNTKPLYLVIALCLKTELEQKIMDQTLTEADFITLKVKYNDPEVSFFSMLKDVPHGEGVADSEGKPASFYVTEPRDLPLELSNLGCYRFTGI
jgi:hypothetical protein